MENRRGQHCICAGNRCGLNMPARLPAGDSPARSGGSTCGSHKPRKWIAAFNTAQAQLSAVYDELDAATTEITGALLEPGSNGADAKNSSGT